MTSFLSRGTVFSLIAVLAFLIIAYVLTILILFVKRKLVPENLCSLKINNDETLTKKVSSGGTLLSTLCQEGISIPSPCGGKATCKQCKIQILEGGAPPLETDKSTFSKKQLKLGWRLSCQFKVKEDVHVHLEERYLDVKEWEGVVISNHNVATFIKELVIALPPGENVPYRSGGYMQFHVPPFKTNTSQWKKTMDEIYFSDWEKYGLFDRELDFTHLEDHKTIRAYSMASYPAENNILKFNIRIATPPFEKGMMKNVPWGICSSYCFSLKEGDKIKLSGPYGESFMVNDHRPLVFLIGGAGSSFGRSHILHLFKTEKTVRQVDFWYGARSLKENIYQQEYEDLAKEFTNFRYHLVLSEPLTEDIEKGWPKNDPLKTNFLFKAFAEGQLKYMKEPEDALYYVCGPPLHNSSILKLLDSYGVQRESIILDDFGS